MKKKGTKMVPNCVPTKKKSAKQPGKRQTPSKVTLTPFQIFDNQAVAMVIHAHGSDGYLYKGTQMAKKVNMNAPGTNQYHGTDKFKWEK